MLGALVTGSGDKRSEFGKRRRSYDEETFESALQTAREGEGWSLVRENKASVRLRRPKRFDEVLENRFWNVLYQLGYDELNKGRQFRISVGKGEDGTEKQIDVFAKDAETVVIAECKACEKSAKRSMLKDLNEFAGLQKPIADAVKRHYGSEFNPKIIWCFVTNNVIGPKKTCAALKTITSMLSGSLSFYILKNSQRKLALRHVISSMRST